MDACPAETLIPDSPIPSSPPLATVRTYDELHAALRKRADDLKITRLSMDEIGGMPPGYFAKVLAPEQIRLAGKHSLGALLGVLGCKLILAEDAEALVRYSSRAQKRKFQVHARDTMLAKRQPGFSRFSGDSEWGEMMQKR